MLKILALLLKQRRVKSTIITTFCALLFGLQVAYNQIGINSIGENKFSIHSSVLHEYRTCYISIPDSYHDEYFGKKEYPIIILLDGYTFLRRPQVFHTL